MTAPRSFADATATVALCCALFAATLLGGCASGPAVRSEAAPGADVAARASFAWEETGISWRDRAPDDADAFVTAHVRAAVLEELRARGYVEDVVAPDFLVSFHVTVRDLPDFELCQMRWDVLSRWRAEPVEVCRVDDATRARREYRAGTLVVFAVDRREGVLLWQGVAEGTARGTADARRAIRGAVAALFREFPPRAG